MNDKNYLAMAVATAKRKKLAHTTPQEYALPIWMMFIAADILENSAPAQDVELLRICTGTSAVGPMMLYQQEGFDLVAVDRDYFVRNYAEPIWENGIQCRHRLILEKRLK